MRLVERVEALSGPSGRVSRAYEYAAWTALFAAVLLWQAFAVVGLAFYVSSIVLRREGF